jgi:hypothetical protein
MEDGLPASTVDTGATKAAPAAGGGANGDPRRRRWLVSSLLVGLVVVVGVVALSFTLTGAFRPSAPATTTAATNQEGTSTSGGTSMHNVTHCNFTDSTQQTASATNGTSSGEPGSDGSATTNSNASSAIVGPFIQAWPEDPYDLPPELETIWTDESVTEITVLGTGPYQAQRVRIRWPECVEERMVASECERLVRDTNPYVTQVLVDAFATMAFQNNRVLLTTDGSNDGNGTVVSEPAIG